MASEQLGTHSTITLHTNVKSSLPESLFIEIKITKTRESEIHGPI